MRLLPVLAGILLVGCSSDRRIYQVSGQVTYQGEPLPAGMIHFDPDVMKNSDGPQGYTLIKDGEYATVARGGKGVFGGATSSASRALTVNRAGSLLWAGPSSPNSSKQWTFLKARRR